MSWRGQRCMNPVQDSCVGLVGRLFMVESTLPGLPHRVLLTHGVLFRTFRTLPAGRFRPCTAEWVR